MDYLVVHEPDEGKLSIAPTLSRKKPVPQLDAMPEEELLQDLYWQMVLIKTGTAVVSAAAVVCTAIFVFD